MISLTLRAGALALVSGLALPASRAAPHASLPSAHPRIVYHLRVDPSDTTGFRVEMRIQGASRFLRLGMARHPEYNDEFWRYVVDLRATSAGRDVPVVREDSAIWRLDLRSDEAMVRYRIVPPPLPPSARGVRAAWKPAVTSTGALLGGGDSFLYLVDDTLAPARVVLDLPAGWLVATGLAMTAPRTLDAPTLAQLLDAPIMVGRLRIWPVAVHGPETLVAYWPSADATPFDTAGLVDGVTRVVRAASELFGWSWPYRRYTFLFEDGALGALEHATSVTIGAPSARLAADPEWPFMAIAHEFFHTWNLVQLRPAGWGALTTAAPARTTGLWWSEGVTIYFARALLRRAGLAGDSAARQQLANLLGRYLGSPGQQTIAPERSSWTINDPPPAAGAPRSDVWTQGELLGFLLDVLIRDSTAMTRSLDDAMRAMVERYGGPRGFTSEDLERTLGQACGCTLHRFFEEHVRGAAPLDVGAFLAPLGWQPVVTRDSLNGRERVTVRLDEAPSLTVRQQMMRTLWLSGRVAAPGRP